MNLKAILDDAATPRWAVEMHTFLPVKSQFVLFGNIRDRFAFPLDDGNYDLKPMHQYLVDVMDAAGFEVFLLLDPVFGVTLLTPTRVRASQTTEVRDGYVKGTQEWLRRMAGQCEPKFDLEFRVPPGGASPRALLEFSGAVAFAEGMVRTREKKVFMLVDYMMGLGAMDKNVESFIRSLILSYEARPFGRDFPYFNTVAWLCDRENELPAWFSLNNPRIRSIAVGKPGMATRRLVCEAQLRHAETDGTPSFGDLSPAEQAATVADFVGHTDGLTLNDVAAISRFRAMGKLDLRRVADAARRYKLGITEDPWQKMIQGREQLPGFAEKVRRSLERRVKGQPQAIQQALTIVRKALLGLSGAQAGGTSSRPKGVLFLAGPTGTGKTELAKSLTEAIFADERAYIRFDMSEFNHEHSDQRLIGAPPGYIGFEAGGELTQAIKERPCSVVLFDEIEKAHSRILDKFLQILDDGQLTSGKGERVYFSEAIIVFTSNLGMKDVNALAQTPTYEELDEMIRRGIRRYFEDTLQRPEILNRLGENIVIFDFIREQSARLILEKKVEAVIDRMREQLGVEILLPRPDWSAPAPEWTHLFNATCGNLSMGGRGIGNKLESALEKPLVDFLSTAVPPQGARVRLVAAGGRLVPALEP